MPRQTTNPKTQTHVYLGETERSWLDEEAQRRDTSISAVIRDLCRERQIQDAYDQAARELVDRAAS